jgi:hypothetical protein
MPTDPALVPSANDPTVRLQQRLAQLESRMGLVEKRTGVSAPAFRVRRGAALTLTNAVVTSVTWTVEDLDTVGMISVPSTSAVIPADGLYCVGAAAAFFANSTSERYLDITIPGIVLAVSRVQADNTAATETSCSTIRRFVAGDAVTVRVYQSSGGNLDLVVDSEAAPCFWCYQISP